MLKVLRQLPPAWVSDDWCRPNWIEVLTPHLLAVSLFLHQFLGLLQSTCSCWSLEKPTCNSDSKHKPRRIDIIPPISWGDVWNISTSSNVYKHNKALASVWTWWKQGHNNNNNKKSLTNGHERVRWLDLEGIAAGNHQYPMFWISASGLTGCKMAARRMESGPDRESYDKLSFICLVWVMWVKHGSCVLQVALKYKSRHIEMSHTFQLQKKIRSLVGDWELCRWISLASLAKGY